MSSGHYLDGDERLPMWQRECADCKLTMYGYSAEDADQMWWDHVESCHPNAYAEFLNKGLVPRTEKSND